MNSEIALKLFKKYGFNSANSLPYLCFIGNRVGIAFKYSDKCYGAIERATFFDNPEEMDNFLKMYRKYIDSGKGENISIVLDNYQVMFPNIIYTREDKALLSDELLKGIKDKNELNDLEKLKVVAKNLLNYYKDVSDRQVKHINNVSILKNILLNKEKELKDEIRKLKKKKETESINTIKTELFRYDNSFYESYKRYLESIRIKDHAINLIKRIWNLNKKLEYSKEYYKSLILARELADKVRLVDLKLDYVKSLKGKKSLFLNVNKQLKQIEEKYKKEKYNSNYVDEEINKVQRKYSFFEKLSIYYLDDYLKECLLYDNYEYIANKYATDNYNEVSKSNIVSELRKSYQLLSFDERRILTLFNSKYRNIFELILEIPDFYDWSSKKLTKYLESQESVSRFKEECIDKLCGRLVQEVNRSVKDKYFIDINYKSFRFFVSDMVKLLLILKKIDDKMVLEGDIKLFAEFNNAASLKNKYVYYLSDNINSIVSSAKNENGIIGIFKILKGTPVLYSPYNIDFGDLYDNNSRLIKEVNNNKLGLIVDVNDVVIMRDRTLSEVYYYKNIVDEINGVSFVKNIKYDSKVNYCNFTIRKK